MFSKRVLAFLAFFTLHLSYANGQSITISGYVKDSLTGETLIGANIRSSDGKFGTVTNAYGFFFYKSYSRI
jgi:hypothetical protein